MRFSKFFKAQYDPFKKEIQNCDSNTFVYFHEERHKMQDEWDYYYGGEIMKRRKFCSNCKKKTRHNQKGQCIPCGQRAKGIKLEEKKKPGKET